MKNRRRRFWGLLLFLMLEIVIWIMPYAGRIYFRFLETPKDLARVVLPGVTPTPVLKKMSDFDILERLTFMAPECLRAWDEKIFKGKTQYLVVSEAGESFLSASSTASSSGLYKKLKRHVTPELGLSWDWKAVEFPKKPNPKKLADRAQDDFAARVYLVFPGVTFFGSHVIEYIWDESLPGGTVASSPFSDKVKLFVIRSGKPSIDNGGWAHEERNIYQDYTALFEEKPERPLEAIALMSDSDNTRSSSRAYFKTIELNLKKTEVS